MEMEKGKYINYVNYDWRHNISLKCNELNYTKYKHKSKKRKIMIVKN